LIQYDNTILWTIDSLNQLDVWTTTWSSAIFELHGMYWKIFINMFDKSHEPGDRLFGASLQIVPMRKVPTKVSASFTVKSKDGKKRSDTKSVSAVFEGKPNEMVSTDLINFELLEKQYLQDGQDGVQIQLIISEAQ